MEFNSPSMPPKPPAKQEGFLRRNKKAVVITSVAALAAAFCAYEVTDEEIDDDYEAYCVNQQTGNRVDDDDCDDDHKLSGAATAGLFYWYFIRKGTVKPAVGTKANGGSFSVPKTGGFGNSGSGGGS